MASSSNKDKQHVDAQPARTSEVSARNTGDSANVLKELQGRSATVPMRGDGVAKLKRKLVVPELPKLMALHVEHCSSGEASDDPSWLAPPVEQSSRGGS